MLKNSIVATFFAIAAVVNAGASTPLVTIESHVAQESGFKVSSHLILGQKDAILVDAQFTRTEARAVAAMIHRSGRRLKTIVVTHGHPDHYFGLEVLTREFPNSRAVALPEVIQDIRATGPEKLAYWKPKYGDDLTDSLVIPEPIASGDLTLPETSLEALPMGPGESEHSLVLYIPALGALITGDLAYNHVHLWLVEDRPAAWLHRLDVLRRNRPITTVYPGHGQPAAPVVLDQNAQYIEDFLTITQDASTAAVALAHLGARYPDYALPLIAELSIGAHRPAVRP